MKIKDQYKEYEIEIKKDYQGRVKFYLGDLTTSQVREYYNLGYIPEEYVIKTKKKKDGGEPKVQSPLDGHDDQDA